MDRPNQTSASPMAPQSQSPLENPPTPGSETKISINGGTNAKIDAANETSEAQVLREDQVQNAINFLSHPKVRSSPVVHRRSFLEKKGLTKEEIDEAFRRVPDPSSNATNGQVYTTNPASQPKSLNTLQPQDPVQTPQPAGPPITVASASPSQQPRRFHLSHALVAAGVVAASGFGSAVLVKLFLVTHFESFLQLERKYFEGFMAALDVQVKEMKSMGDAIRRLESTRDDRFSEDKPIYENVMHTTGNVRSSPPPMLRESLTAANRNSYTEPWEVARSAQQRPSYSLQHETSEERLGSRIDDGYGPPPDRNVNGYDTSEPWWSKKNVRITEMETEEQQKQLHYGVESNERPKPRGWVPPQPPAIVMPGAADAIRRPKPLPPKQPTGDAQSVASSDDGKEGETRVPDSVTEADLNNTIPAGSSSQSGIQEESATALEVI
ncbi:hypothetical protein ZIOFF_017023 [Zingiber officinale]|uniref:Peroxisomal membrane protein PEX14 n=1 Tax=Zingiber officinale TaxID=94328 RepID=A0A8J5H6L7_ZINOF|nr:hypothetical protein ZIOFF_017023 [Zingiber officinale]